MPRVSVVLSAYNGERFIVEQLESLAAQTLMPDEVRIVDDCSTDDTYELVCSFIQERNLSNWTITRNSENRGYKANFRDLLLSASADYVFPCDQDDIWHVDKIERMVAVMEQQRDIDLLVCIAEPFYEKGSQKSASNTFRASELDTQLLKLSMEPALMYVNRPGCAYCARASFLASIEPYWIDWFTHDGVMWRCAAMSERLAFLNIPLVDFRRHDSNTSSRQKEDVRSRIIDLKDLIIFSETAKQYVCDNNIASENALQAVDDIISWTKARKAFLSHENMASNFRIMRSHSDYYPSPRSIYMDLLLGCIPGFKI